MRVLLVRDHQEGQHAEARGQHARDGGRGVRVREVRLCDAAQGQDEDSHGQGIDISIPNSELQTYFYNLDEYPIYVYYTDTDTIEKKYSNFYEFVNNYIDNKTKLLKFSKKDIKQDIPISLYDE